MSVYYIDPVSGTDSADGLTSLTPKKNYHDLILKPGDTVAFKCGSFYREPLTLISGEEGSPITYTSYGDGALPVFCGSVDVSDTDDWEEISPNIWKCIREIPGDIGNFVFNENECTATLCWEKSSLHNQGDFFDNRFGETERRTKTPNPEILLYSKGNPASVYSHIECVSYGYRQMGSLRSNITIENLRFINSGVHGLAGEGKNITIRGCTLENIGGCAWNSDLRIRFGNAIELWTYGENILIENCSFKNVYDSCVTHQGPSEKTIPTNNFICKNNVFDTYGMAAFEYRDKLPINSEFTSNICKNAGCGFAMLGETLPRRSEIWPQPMGHHIFLWRIEKATEGGNLKITDNVFSDSPAGAAIYSIISREAENQIYLNNNTYIGNHLLLNRYNGKDYTDFDIFQKETGCELNGILK